MTKFGGPNSCIVPIAFKGRYFILEPGNPPSFSVVLEHHGAPTFEIENNEPSDNPVSDVFVSNTGSVTVSEKGTGKFLYKVDPGLETNIVFGKEDGGEISARISARQIQVSGVILRNCTLTHLGAGLALDEAGGVGVGAAIPGPLLTLFDE